ncbi:pilus assembly protein N-terminal domain-containing protein [Gilvimarinus sp. SDUM040013]|uniref:Pilus assembly protein N-terminal domain-containing protein n=1 Tax=Gilvimarinus gilvus TaxID=3058038 RepID=A0ABU4RY65_9GAMM|nr:pilus assembly protein N-terminal domain-containing protein [Gilvimarinus sp. SDUM040013]MDO3386265.1 pilus assembly protein N-terminal domain-containing protein [Gilvimarinus sp. SDUM040013]MDX6849740.1 pilus assembly protein N-terminal domain-containing protein [Gilvimarinus sp. SDUM040013]
MNIRVWLGGVLALLMTVQVGARILPESLTLYAGESRVIEAPEAVRISVGMADMVSSTLLKNGEIVLTANTVGETNMQIWFADGSRETLSLSVVEAYSSGREVQEIRQLLGSIPGIEIKTTGRHTVVDGILEARDMEKVEIVEQMYEDLVVLARVTDEFEQKMIFFDVQISEFDRSKTEELGINWQKSFAGPSLNYAKNWGTSGALAAGMESPFGYETGARGILFGVASEITSIIDLLEQTGSAIVLSSPRLSARSGGTAGLTVGGEVPVITSSISGSSVEYKDYGVILDIAPKLDLYGNISARVEVSISQLDLAQAVDGQPAFKKRATSNDVKLKPGDTLVLSGLITREEQATVNKVKWLADIPILGELFKSKSFSGGETEMVIFITPHILGDLKSGPNQRVLNRVDEYMEEHENYMRTGLID